MSHEHPARCDDETTWNHKGEEIDLLRLLALIEAHGGAEGLDLHGCKITSIDLSYSALQPHILSWSGGEPHPPWRHGVWGIKLQGAHLEQVQIVTSNLRGADFLFAHLERAGFVSCILDEAAIVRASAKGMMILFGSARGATFNNSDLRESTLSTDLTGASFGGANMQGARLHDAILEGVDLRLSDLRGAMLHGAKFNRTKIRPGNFGWSVSVGDELVASGKQEHHRRVRFVEAADVYRDLKANFLGLGYYDEASWSYIKQKQMEKMEYRSYWRRRWPLSWLNPIRYIRLSATKKRRFRQWICRWLTSRTVRAAFRKWAISWFFEALTAYGERPVLPLLWAAAVALVFFPMLYWVVGVLPDNTLWNAIVFSLTTFGTLSFNRLQPADTLGSVLAASEAFCGVLLFALFVFTLGNRMSRS